MIRFPISVRNLDDSHNDYVHNKHASVCVSIIGQRDRHVAFDAISYLERSWVGHVYPERSIERLKVLEVRVESVDRVGERVGPRGGPLTLSDRDCAL